MKIANLHFSFSRNAYAIASAIVILLERAEQSYLGIRFLENVGLTIPFLHSFKER